MIAKSGMNRRTVIQSALGECRVLSCGAIPIAHRRGRQQDVVKINFHTNALGLGKTLGELQTLARQRLRFFVGEKPEAQPARRNRGPCRQALISAQAGVVCEICRASQVLRRVLFEQFRDAPVHDLTAER